MEAITITDGIIIKDKKILLLKKFKKDYYEFPGGKVKEGETLSECLERELKEETGIIPVKYKALHKLKLTFENKNITDHCFIVEEYDGEPKINEKDTFEEMIWKTPKEIENIKTAPNVKPLLRKLS